MMKDLE